MTNYERYMTIRTVISDLADILKLADENPEGHSEVLSPEMFKLAQQVVQQITGE